MKASVKLFALCCLAFCFTASGHAQSPITALKCTSAQGSTLSAPVYSFHLFVADNYNGSPSIFLTTDLFSYPALTSSTAPASYATCLLGDGTAAAFMSNVTISQVNAYAGGTGTDTTAVLNFASVTYKDPPSIDGQAPVGTFGCQLGGGSSFLAPVLSYELTPSTNGTGMIDMDASYLSTLLSGLSQGTSNCTLSVGGATVSIQYFYIDDVYSVGSGAGVSTPGPQVTASLDWDQGFDDTVTGAADYSGMSPIGSLTCQAPDNTTLTAPVYYFFLAGSLTVYADFGSYAALSAVANGGPPYTTCTLDDGVEPITITEAFPVVALPTGYGGPGSSVPRLYAGVTLYYSSMTVGEVTTAGAKPGVDGRPGLGPRTAGIGVSAPRVRAAAKLQ